MIPLVSTITAIISLSTWIHGRIACDIYDVKTSDLPPLMYSKEEFEDTKGAIRIRKSQKNRQHNGQQKKYKKTNNDQQNIHIKLKIE